MDKMKQIITRLLVTPIYFLVIVPQLNIHIGGKILLSIAIFISSLLIAISKTKPSRIFLASTLSFMTVYFVSSFALLTLEATDSYFIQPFLIGLSVFLGTLASTYYIEEFLNGNRWLMSTLASGLHLSTRTLMLVMLKSLNAWGQYHMAEGLAVLVTISSLFIYYVIKHNKLEKLRKYVDTENWEDFVYIVDMRNTKITHKHTAKDEFYVDSGESQVSLDKLLESIAIKAFYSDGYAIVRSSQQIHELLEYNVKGTHEKALLLITYKEDLVNSIQLLKDYKDITD